MLAHCRRRPTFSNPVFQQLYASSQTTGYCQKSQVSDSVKNFTKQRPRNCHFRHLKCHVTRMTDHFGSDLNQLLTERSERPFLHRPGQYQSPQKITKVVSQSKELKSDLIIHKIMAGKPCPIQHVFAFLNPLLGRASLVTELHDIARFPPKVRDYEVDSWKELPRMPLDLGDDSASDLPTGCLIPKAMIPDNRLLWWTPHRSSQHVFNLLMQYWVVLQSYRIEVSLSFEVAINLGISQGGIVQCASFRIVPFDYDTPLPKSHTSVALQLCHTRPSELLQWPVCLRVATILR